MLLSRDRKGAVLQCAAGLGAFILAAGVLCGCAAPERRAPDAAYAAVVAAQRAGDLPKALAGAQKGHAAWQRDAASPWHWKFRLTVAEILLMQSESAQALPLLREDVPPEVPDRLAIQARLTKDRGYAALMQSRLAEAVETLTQAYSAAIADGAGSLLPEILILRGSARVRKGELELAEADFRQALTAAERASDTYWQANATGSAGFLYLNRYRYDEAIEWFERTMAISQREGYNGVTEKAIGNLGWCYYRLGDFEKAESSFKQNEAYMQRTGRTLDRQISIGHLANLRSVNRDFKGALDEYQRALAIAEYARDDFYKAKWLSNIGAVYVDLKDPDAAEPYIARALALSAQSKDPSERMRPLLQAAEAALLRKDSARAEQIYSELIREPQADSDLQWGARAGLGNLYAAKGDAARARAEFDRAVAIIDASWSKLRNDQSKLTFPSRLAQLYQCYVDLLMSTGNGPDALAFAESRRAKLLAEKMGGETGPASFRDTARQLDAVLLSYWVSPDRSYLWATTADGFRAITLPGELRIRELVDRHSKAIQDGRTNAAGRELYDVLVSPARDLIPSGARVVLVPDGPLHKLNFETLVNEAGRYWIEDAAVEIAPSLRLLDRKRPAGTKGHSILLIGDPVRSDPPLPHAKDEIGGIAGMFTDRVVLSGAEARPEAYRAAAPGKFSLIHFAAHAIANRESPLDSAVILSPGKDSAKLYAREVEQVPLNADLVTVSACHSSGARDYSGEGRVGFAWAFLSAGARSVIATLWDVNDQSTSAFMQTLYARVQQNQRPAAALRAAKLEFLRSGTARQKPYYWAPFQIYIR